MEIAVDPVTALVGEIMYLYYMNGKFGTDGDLDPVKERKEIRKSLTENF